MFSANGLDFFSSALLADFVLSASDLYLLAGKAAFPLIWQHLETESDRKACDLQLSEMPLAPSVSAWGRESALGGVWVCWDRSPPKRGVKIHKWDKTEGFGSRFFTSIKFIDLFIWIKISTKALPNPSVLSYATRLKGNINIYFYISAFPVEPAAGKRFGVGC